MPRTSSSSSPSREILEAALQGLESQRAKLDEQIAEVRSLMGGGSGARRGRPRKNAVHSGATESGVRRTAPRKKRTLSPEARKRIAAAQKKRWASFRKSQE